MENENNTAGETGLRFFGIMTASISHEVKNVLAIINENAGILEDFILMENKGVPLNSEKIGNVAKRILKQIQRADGIIKNMNRFAHSSDSPIESVDIGEIVLLVVTLSGRFASNRGITINQQTGNGPIPVVTHPFYLENLIWQCLDFSMDVSGEDKTVELSAERTANGAVIRFSDLKGLTGDQTKNFPTEKEESLVNVLRARLIVDGEAGEIVLTLPGVIDS